MRIAHCQFNVKTGDFEANLEKVKQGLQRADEERAAIVCFPECCLTGYPDDAGRARAGAFAADSSEMMRALDATSGFRATAIVGFNEIRGEKLFNTAAVLQQGHLLGVYSKCSAYMPFHTQGREFPVFERDGLTFGVIICSDGGYIEPARILAIKGARVIFAPHFNYIGKDHLLTHFVKVRHDHTARAIENAVYFVRGNNVVLGEGPSLKRTDGVGYGDSYIIDPYGEIVVRSRRHQEDFIFCDIDPALGERKGDLSKAEWSFREFGEILRQASNDHSRASS
jgi:predicted amidohydrolase